MKIYLFTLLCFVAYLPANAEDKNTDKKQNMNNYKKDVTLWYEAFTKKDAALLDKILHETWVDIPSPPGTAPGSTSSKRENCSNLAHRGLDERPSSIGCFREIVGGKSASTESRKELYVAKRCRKSRGPPQY